MNKGIRYGIAAIVLAAMVCGLVCVLQSVRADRAVTTCTGIDVILKDTLKFVDEEEVKAYLVRKNGTLIGVPLDSLNLGKMERQMMARNMVLGCEAWTTGDGILHVSVKQRIPVLRLQRGDRSWYLDDKDCVFPARGNSVCKVPVVTGAIPDMDNGNCKEWLANVNSLMKTLSASRKWKDAFTAITVMDNGDFVLTPARGKERIILGPPVDVEKKLNKLEEYYTLIRPTEDGSKYRSVNLKYNKQIICRKDI